MVKNKFVNDFFFTITFYVCFYLFFMAILPEKKLIHTMEIDIANITRSDIRIVVHGAVQMMYADGEVSYHEKTAVNKIVKAANLNSAETVRLGEDIKHLSSKALIPSLSSVDARRLYFLMIEFMFFSDDNVAAAEVKACKEYAKLLRLKEAQDALEKDQAQNYLASSEKLFKIFARIREKFAHISNTW